MDKKINNTINKIASHIANTSHLKTTENITKQDKIDISSLTGCFKNYLEKSFKRYSKIKTLLYRDRPVSLKDHYVPTDYIIDNEKINGEEIFKKLSYYKKNIIVGTAGSGKSVLLRHLFTDLIEKEKNILPILIELRLLITPDNDYSILDFIYKTLLNIESAFRKDQLHHALKEGGIALFLDGFDEIDFEKKEAYERELIELSNTYPNVIFVISSRPDDCFSSWDEFHIFHALALNKEQSIDLISRIEYDTTVKEKFISELRNGLHEKHHDFLSNPLLLTMMLLTYEQLAEIPEKVHIFYEQAFDTLYHKHDALKELYKRKSYSSLPIDDFKKIFSAFCIITYSDRKMSFSYHEVIDYLEKAIKIEGFKVTPRYFFDDLVKSVCIIQKDGNTYTFSHRSFQEYFAAYFISQSQSIDTGKVLDNISKSHFRDNVINMLCELNRELIETKWIIPRLKQVIDLINTPYTENNVIGFISNFYSEIMIHDEGLGFLLTNDKPFGIFTSCLHLIYRGESNLLYPKNNNDTLSEENKIDRDLFFKHTSINENHESLNLSDIPENSIWLNETSLPAHCERKFNFINNLYIKLTNKYLEKENDLTSLLLT